MTTPKEFLLKKFPNQIGKTYTYDLATVPLCEVMEAYAEFKIQEAAKSKKERKEDQRLIIQRQEFAEIKKNNPDKCYCAYDDLGVYHTDRQDVDWDNPVDFSLGIFKCRTCGFEGQMRYPHIIVDSNLDDPLYNKDNQQKILDHFNEGKTEEQTLFWGYGVNNQQWVSNLDYAIFEVYDNFIGIGNFVGLQSTQNFDIVIGYAGYPYFDTEEDRKRQQEWREAYQTAPVFKLKDGRYVSGCIAIPVRYFDNPLIK